MKNRTLWLLSVALLIINCSREPEFKQALISGTITVADSVDSTHDYSGIELLITHRSSQESPLDTLFIAQTDSNGFFNGEIVIPRQGIYPLIVSRNGNALFGSQLILADDDTLKITGELPDLRQNFTVDSREQRAMETFNRVDRGYNRLVAFINAGQVADSLINDEIKKWSDIYWEVYEKYPGTLASKLAARQSVSVLRNFDDQLMFDRLNEALEDDEFIIGFASGLGKQYVAETQGVDAAIEYLDSLKTLTSSDQVIQNLSREQIAFYFDSARVEDAKEMLATFEKEYAEDEKAMEWAKNIGYDLAYLAPGYRVPDFTFITQEGDTVSAESLIGTPYLLEITPVSNRLYQSQYDRTVVIQQIYKNYGLQVFTIPLDKSDITIESFFEERAKYWPVADFGKFDIQNLIETFNITRIPTRILVDQKGNIVRKYVGEEFNDVISGLNKIVNQANQES